ncbi:MAG: signal peptide peptidase SppA [Chitinophagaceae bacterium]
MRQFFKMLFACFLAIFLFIGLFFMFFMGIAAVSSSGSDVDIEKNSVLLLDATDPITEQGQENPLGELTGDPSSVLGLNDVLASIEDAKTNDKIKGIYIKMGQSTNGWASLQEIRNALLDFKASKKFIYAYGELADQKSYYLASAGDKVFMNPVGMFEFLGLSIKSMFFKNALDKLEIKAETFHCGKYKGAHEPFSRSDFSDSNRYQMTALLNDFQSELMKAAILKSGKDSQTLYTAMQTGAIKFPSDALKLNLIDATIYGDSVEHIIKNQLSLDEDEKISFVTPSTYAESISKKSNKNQIAILYAEGSINDGSGDGNIYSKDITKQIRKIAKNDKIKAVVLRVNSPGGSALASEIIYHELMELKKKKKIVVSMGNYAASGGYYISCAADSIFADPNTLTGSIGVVGVLFNVGDMMNHKLGVTTDEIKTGPYAGFPNMTRPMTDGERQWIQAYLDTTYTLFKSRVAQARKLTMDDVENLAQGHVYSGTTAKKIKLVDEMGNTQRAIQSAAKLAGLTEYSLVEYPQKRDQIQELISMISGKKNDDVLMKKVLGDDYKVYSELSKLRQQKSYIQTLMPWVLDIR